MIKNKTWTEIYIVLALFEVMLFFYSVLEMAPVEVDISDFMGLTSHLTTAYWIGYILVILCSVTLYMNKTIKNDSIYLMYLIIIGLFLFGVSIFAEQNARFAWSYYPSGETNNILELNRVDNVSTYPLLSYRSWPGFHFESIFAIHMANVSMDGLIKYMPFIWVLSVIFMTYYAGKLFRLSANQCFLMSFLVISSFWIMNYYYGPQSVAYILYLLFFISTIFLTIVFRNSNDMMNKRGRSVTILSVLTYLSTVATHMLTSIALIVSFFSSIFMKTAVRRDKNKAKFALMAVILFVVIFFIWHMYFARSMFSVGIKDLIRQIVDGQLFEVFSSEKYSPGQNMRQIIHYARISYLGIYAVLMAVAGILYMKGLIKREYREAVKMCFLWLIGIASMLVLRYGAEIDDRIYMFALLPMASIIAMTFDRKIMVLLILLFALIHIPAHYGTESYDMIFTTELKGSKFLASQIKQYDSVNYYYTPLIKYHGIPSVNSKGFNAGIYDPDYESLNSSIYVVHSRQISNYLLYIFGIDKTQNWVRDRGDNIMLMYSNGYYDVYMNVLKK